VILNWSAVCDQLKYFHQGGRFKIYLFHKDRTSFNATCSFNFECMLRVYRGCHIPTSCARGDTMCLRPCKLTISSHLFDRWHLFRHVGYLRHQQQVDLRPFDRESGVRVTCDVGYLCANFSLSRPLCSRIRPDVRDRQTSDKSIA